MTILFEVSWEVCNKVGGIYTVVSSKALEMKKHIDSHILVGPYFAEKVRGVFEEIPAPLACKDCVESLAKEGIKIHIGKWLIKGSPLAILVDHTEWRSKSNEVKKHLWEKYQLDSLGTEFYDFDDPLIWSWTVGRVIEAWTKTQNEQAIVHAHEWLSGGALIYAKENMSTAATVFTTHATMLGRTLATHGVDLYDVLNTIDPEQAAKTYGPAVWTKWQFERLLAKEAHVFTTVSKITSIEATAILQKKPDIVLPNGVDSDQFPTIEQAGIRRQQMRDKLETFLMYYFFPYYRFDLDKTTIMFTGGRYEFRDKGTDVLIESLRQLNDRLKKEKSKQTVVMFLWVPAGARGVDQRLIENRALFYDVKDTLDEHSAHVKNRIAQLVLSEKQITQQDIFEEDTLVDLKIKSRRFKKSGIPPIVTHDLHNEEYDPIIQALKASGLKNEESDPVKVVFYPLYLTGADGLLDLTYYEALLGTDLGVFASYYEPWGYTPMEAAAHAVPAVTTDVAGFGLYVKENVDAQNQLGVSVLQRRGAPDNQISAKLAEELYHWTTVSSSTFDRARVSAKFIANKTDWKFFIKHYLEAYELAKSRVKND